LLALAAVTFAACTGNQEMSSVAPNGETVAADEAPEEATTPAVTQSDAAPETAISFELLDANANGFLAEREFNLLLVQTDLALEGQFSNADSDGDGRLDPQEYEAFLAGAGTSRTADTGGDEAGAVTADRSDSATRPGQYILAEESFKKYDVDDSSYLDADEFRSAVVMAGLPVENQFSTYDTNDDDRLAQDEYRAFFEDEAGNLDLTGSAGTS
jgi:Ca2+-binding EF-hand superfamily protein